MHLHAGVESLVILSQEYMKQNSKLYQLFCLCAC